jgi:hypothetical protein
MQNGASAEIAVAGHEGLVGIFLFMEASPRRAGPSSRAQATVFVCWPPR